MRQFLTSFGRNVWMNEWLYMKMEARSITSQLQKPQ